MASPESAAEIRFEPMFRLPQMSLRGLMTTSSRPEGKRQLQDDAGLPAIETVLELMASWRDVAPFVRTTVPVRTADLANPEIVARLESAVRATSVPWQCIDIGVDASALTADVDAVARNLEELRQRRVTSTLLSFGTGFSSLQLVTALPLSGMEIHRSFTRRVDTSDRLMAAQFAVMASTFAFDAHAHSVTSAAELEALIEIGFKVARGPALAEAMPAAEVREWLLRQSRG